MCNCIVSLINHGCLFESKDENNKVVIVIHATKDRKVLAGCERVNYCPTCGKRVII
jgi:competence CoiA-like predicted nuclease